MDGFKIKTYVPSLSTFNYYPELNNKQIIDINKFLSSNDEKGLEKYLNKILQAPEKLTSIDKLFILTNLRMLCIGNEIKIKLKNSKSTITISLSNFLERLLKETNTIIPNYLNNDLIITFKQGNKLIYSNMYQFLLDNIDNLVIKDNIENYTSLSLKEKTNILLRIKKNIINDIKNHIIKTQPYFDIVKIESSNLNMAVSFFDNSIFRFIKFIFKSSISNIYNKIYFCGQRLNISYSDFLNLTSSEIDLLIAIYKKNNSIK